VGIETWTVHRPPNGTPHDGGGQYWLRTPTPVKSGTMSTLAGQAVTLDLQGQGSYVLAPPSLHPGGGCYAFAGRPSTIFTLPRLNALDWLKLEPAPPADSTSPRRIPRLAGRLLQGNPAAIGHYPTRSEAEAAICAALANAGFDFAEALLVFLAHPGPGKFTELHAANPWNAMRYLRLTWRNAQEWTATQATPARQLARRLRAWAAGRPWPGRGGSSDRAVYLAHLAIVERCGRDPHAASVRELGERAGLSARTAGTANSRLVDAGLLELVTPATPSLSHVWRLLAPAQLDAAESIPSHSVTARGPGVLETCIPSHSSPARMPDLAPGCIPSHPVNTPVRECETLHVAHDAFRWSGLNKSSAEVLTLLQATNAMAVTDLAARTGRHRTTVQRKLAEMFRLGLVEPLGDGWWRAVPEVDLEQVAEELGTAGAGDRQQAQHQRDRRTHRLLLECERPRR
ncbi:MAG: bifunctional DNA primase/polymerase, partial [Chloroflexi bacterium]|nr:bifunctional DNA primase/polymerase [Chloroflexota bacterium]